MPTPIVHRKNPQFIKSYNYIESLTGVGYAIVYLTQATDSSGMTQHITSSNTVQAFNDVYAVGHPNTPATKEADLDFDLLVNNSFELEGTAFFQFTHYSYGAGTDTVDSYVIIKLRRVHNSVETDVASVQSPTISVNGTSYARRTLPMTVPRAHFAAGDTLRITVEIWGDNNGGHYGADTGGVYLDPTNTTQYGGFSSQFSCHIPVKVL